MGKTLGTKSFLSITFKVIQSMYSQPKRSSYKPCSFLSLCRGPVCFVLTGQCYKCQPLSSIKDVTEKDRLLSASCGLKMIQLKHKEGMCHVPFKTLARWSKKPVVSGKVVSHDTCYTNKARKSYRNAVHISSELNAKPVHLIVDRTFQ